MSGYIKRFKTELCLLAAVCALFALLENRFPYYFLQDDSLTSFLPMLDYNYRTLISGHIPFYNPHQLLGMPLLSVGQFGTLYPPAYASAWLSNIFLGHSCASLDFLMFFHLACGALGFFALARRLGLSDGPATLGALGWALNGCSVFLGSSWCNIGPAIAYFPWILFSAFGLGTTARASFAGLVIWRLLFFYSGFVQFFVYGALFEAAAFVLCQYRRGEASGGALLRLYAASWAATGFFTLILLLPMWAQTLDSAMRSQAFPYELFKLWTAKPLLWLWGLLWPFSTASGGLAANGANYFELYTPYFAHIGYVPLALLLAWPLLRCRGPLNRLRWAGLLFGLFAALWAAGVLSPLLYHVPVLNRFRYPMKLMLFANFFFFLAASANFQILLEQPSCSKRGRGLSVLAVGLLLFGFGALYGVSPRRNFYIEKSPVPYEEREARMLSVGRVMSLGEHLGRGEGAAASVAGYNFATLSGLCHFAGSDVMVRLQTALATGWLNSSAIALLEPARFADLRQYWASWGVRWYLVKGNQAREYAPVLEKNGLRLRSQEPSRAIFEDVRAWPMAYEARSRQTLPYEIKPYGIEIVWDSPEPGVAVANFIWLPYFRVLVDGRPAKLLKAPDLRLAVEMAAGKHKVEFRYGDPWFYLGLYLAAAALALMFVPSLRRSALKSCGLE